MPDKKEIRALLEILGAASSRNSTLTKLNKLDVHSDDPRIKTRCKALQAVLSTFPMETCSLLLSTKRWVQQGNMISRQQDVVHAVTVIADFCNQELAAVEPQWQRTALAAGWTPPQ